MPAWGVLALVGLAYLYGRSRRLLEATGAGEPAVDVKRVSVGEAAGDVAGGLIGTFGAVHDALGAPLKSTSLFQQASGGQANGARESAGRW